MSHASPSPADLLAHVSWVRSLARELVRDGAEAEDLAQEALVRVLEHPPRSEAALGGFLRRVLFNLRGERHRKDARRVERERLTARAEAAPAADEIAEGLARQRELVEAVERLEPVEREAIVLRFFEQLPPRRIAARLGVPVKTVDARLQRALARLREDFDRRDGGRERWARAFVAWLRSPSEASAHAPRRGVPAWSGALVAGALAAGWFLVQGAGRANGSLPDGGEPRTTERAGETVQAPRASDGAERAPVGTLAAEPRIRGRVLGLDGAGVAGARVELFELPFAGFDLM